MSLRQGAASTQYDELCRAIAEGIGPLLARSVCNAALQRSGISKAMLERRGATPQLVDQLVRGTEWFCKDEEKRKVVAAKLGTLTAGRAGRPEVEQQAAVIAIEAEGHIVEARSSVRRMSQALGFGHTDQIKISTAVSEIARNIYKYAGKGTISITAASGGARPVIHIVARDDGPGIANLEEVLARRYRSKTGLGLGIVGCRNLMDEFQIVAPQGGGTCVTMAKYL